jgi:hypothetical protein
MKNYDNWLPATAITSPHDILSPEELASQRKMLQWGERRQTLLAARALRESKRSKLGAITSPHDIPGYVSRIHKSPEE